MVNCTYTDVRRVISTGLEDADITAMIIETDAEMSDRDVGGSANLRKRISALITASVIALKDPKSRGAGDYSETTRSPEEWRNAAEALIGSADTPVGKVG